MKLSRDQVNVIIKNGQAKGLTGESVLNGLVSRGYEPEGVDVAAAKTDIAAQQAAAQPPAPAAPGGVAGALNDAGGDIAGVGSDLSKTITDHAQNINDIVDAMNSGDQGKLRSFLQVAGQLAGAGAGAIDAGVKGAVKLVLPQSAEDAVKGVVGKFGAAAMANPQVQSVLNWYHGLPEKNQRDIDAAGGVLSLVGNLIGGSAAEGVGGAAADAAKSSAGTAADAAKSGISTIVDTAKAGAAKAADLAATAGEKLGGVKAIGSDLLDRIPKAAENIGDTLAESAARAERIKAATPEVAQAIKSNLDDRIINTVTAADKPTQQAYKDVVDIAEQSAGKIGMKTNPTIVGGELASKQYDLINTEKQAIGAKIGEVADNLAKTTGPVDLKPAVSNLDEVLAKNGVKVTEGANASGDISFDGESTGKKALDFSGSKFTPGERTKIQQLYDLSTEAGDQATPRQIFDKNQLFSKLKRESNLEGIGNIVVDTADGQKSSLFNVFKDIYSKTLDDLSPELRGLNQQYRQYSNLTDDIENSILKTPNFAATASQNPAEFAKVNLRRIFGESQSSPVYEGIADQMDAAARKLGYSGATPKTVAEFAQEMRKLFPDIIPKTGFTGSIDGITGGAKSLVSKVSSIGVPTLTDQQAALKKLLQSLLSNK